VPATPAEISGGLEASSTEDPANEFDEVSGLLAEKCSELGTPEDPSGLGEAERGSES
jgi:hypothetical protein